MDKGKVRTQQTVVKILIKKNFVMGTNIVFAFLYVCMECTLAVILRNVRKNTFTVSIAYIFYTIY